jgi:hypothetical protein
VRNGRWAVKLPAAAVRTSCPQPTMTSTLAGQLLLGTDKRNPLFTVYHQDEGERAELHVYYGLELLEVVSAERDEPDFKMLVGRLANAGVSRRVLQHTFEVDPKTMQRWGRALRCRNASELIRVFAGRRANRKLTPEIQAYVRMRWPDLAKDGTYGIGQRLRQEIQRVFNLTLSQETLRPLLAELRSQPIPAASAGANAGATIAGALPQSSDPSADHQAVGSPAREKPCDCIRGDATLPPESAGSALALGAPPQTLWSDHLGLLMFAPVLIAVAQVIQPAEALFKQWLASVLLGALNIEQTKFLNWADLSRLLGTLVRFPHPQRQELERVATPANVDALLRFNAGQIGAHGQSQFYFDPHTKHYTGQESVLKGWCAAIRWADKALHSDFIHTLAGEPLYFETTDNFADLRQRFFAVVQRCREVMSWPVDRVVSFVVDRAIFGQEVFEQVLADPTLHLITWEKGYEAQAWPPPAGITGAMVIERARNRAEDIRGYHLEYWDRPWPKNERLRQLVVRAANPQNRVIQVSILTDDSKAAAVEIIRLMFNRWVQENDFKYLDKHYGINQITSYGVTGYDELHQQVEDRQVCSGQLKALREQRRQLRSKQGRLLLLQARGEHEERERQQQIQKLEKLPVAEHPGKALARLRQRQSRWKSTGAERQKQIQELSGELAQLETRMEQASPTESRLEQMIAGKMVKLDPEKKRLMDSLRIIARNVFYAALQPFKKAYNNYRDDHDQFRQLTQASGVLEVGAERIVVHLMPRVNYPPQLRRILSAVLEGMNAGQPVLPDGSGP